MKNKNPKSRRSARVIKAEYKKTIMPHANPQSLMLEDTATQQHAIAYDENLLEKYRGLWQSGDWESLVALDIDILEHHPDRAKLALVIASAWQQLNNHVAARCFITQSVAWGCDKKLIVQLLLAGVHNTLGRAAAINQDESRALNHFKYAVDGVRGGVKHISHIRITKELAQLGLPPKTIQQLPKEVANLQSSCTSNSVFCPINSSDTLTENTSIGKMGEAVNVAMPPAQISEIISRLIRIEEYGYATARRISVNCGFGTVMIRTSVGFVLCSDEDYALIMSLIESGELEVGTRQFIQRILGPGDVFVDVGANVGMHTLAAAQVLKGGGRVIAIEPYSPTAQLLEKTVWINGFADIIEIHTVAVASDKGVGKLYLGAASGHHSLYPLEKYPISNGDAVDVSVTTLDEILSNEPFVTLIKIDAEGAEIDILEGSSSLINLNQDIGMIAEFGLTHLHRTGISTREWLYHFLNHGFEYKGIHPYTGALYAISIDELDKTDTVNLFFARPQSPLWEKERQSA